MVAKKAAGRKSANSPKRIPKIDGYKSEFGKAGQFVSKDKWALFVKPELDRFRKDEKNRKLREKRQQKRDAQKKLLGFNGPDHARAEMKHTTHGWGSTSTSRLRSGRTYYWHGAFMISGASGEQIKGILNAVGSSAKVPDVASDGSYSVVITPGFGAMTPAQAFETFLPNGESMLQDQINTRLNELQKHGADVEFLGAFYNPERI